MKKKLNTWQKVFILFVGVLLVSSAVFFAEAYLSHQQVKSASDQCYDKGGFPKVVKSGFDIELFECNFYDEN